jgi:hypothetical protein
LTDSVQVSNHNRHAFPGRLQVVDGDGDRKLGLAFMLACPACAGGFFLAIGAAFGATALALKGFALAALVTLITGLWARNAWNRRNEDAACEVSPQPAAASRADEVSPGS